MKDRKARLARYAALILKACRGSGQTNAPSDNREEAGTYEETE